MVAIIIVCHKGELELKAAFLIYSIRKYLKGQYTVYVGIPENGKFTKEPDQNFIAFCETNKIQTFHFRNPYLIDKHRLEEGDLISNKLFVLQIDFKEEWVVFLDTDTVILGGFNINELTEGVKEIKVKPANRPNVKNWESIYSESGLVKPNEVVYSAIDKVQMPPYFNSGVIVVHHSILPSLLNRWIDLFYLLSTENIRKRISFPMFHRDQIALALAISACKINYNLLEEQFNFPVRGKRIKNLCPLIVHYHNPYSIYFEKNLKREFLEFNTLNPQFIHTASYVWESLFGKRFYRKYYTVLLELIRFNKYRFSELMRKIWII